MSRNLTSLIPGAISPTATRPANRRRKALWSALLILPLALFCSGCGDDSDSGSSGSGLEGKWTLVSEGGRPVSGYGVELSLSESSFTSRFTGSDGSICSWSGSAVSDDSQTTWTASSATAAPCTAALGQTRTARWTLSEDGNTLTLTWSGAPLQVYRRRS